MQSISSITTERLYIRRITAEDHVAVRQIWSAVAETEYARYDRPKDLAEEAVSLRIQRWAAYADSEAHMFFAVCLQGTVIGYIALNRRESGYELGYCFHPACHGKGYARESIGAVLGLMKSYGARQIEAGTALSNMPSVRLLRSLGFIQVGTEKVSFYKDADGNNTVFEGGVFVLPL